MAKHKVNRKNLKVIDGSKAPAPGDRIEDLPNVNGSSHGQRTSPTQPTDAAEFAAAMFFWPLDVMRWWMPRTG
jgi:hypothetical protein